MARNSPAMGLIAFLLFLTIPAWLVIQIYPGAKGILIAAALAAIVLAIGLIGFKQKGWAFFSMLADWVEDMTSDGKSGGSKKRKARRPPSYWTSKLVVAVGDQCEFPRCRKTRHLEVHHIDPFAAGGANSLSNLIVVCPEHHKDFGVGAMNKTRQREYIRRQGRFVDPRFPAVWKQKVLARETGATDDDFGF